MINRMTTLAEINKDILEAKKMVTEVELYIGKREDQTVLVNKLINAENFLTYCLSRLENAVILPCKVGDTVYKCVFQKNGKGSFVEYKVVGFHLGEFPNSRGQKRNEYLVIYHEVTDCISHLNLKKLGKTVFLTREEAEQALKERTDNNG